MLEQDKKVYEYLENQAKINPEKWVSKEELIDALPEFFKASENLSSHDICVSLNLVRLRLNKARALGQIEHLVLLNNHSFKLATSREEAIKYCHKDYDNGIKLLVRYYQNIGALKEDGQGRLIDCNGNILTEESLEQRFNQPFEI